MTALFSGLLTKVGVYALYRLYTVVFDADPRYRGVLLALAGLTMVVRVLGAAGRGGMRDILSFHIVSQNGYLLLGLALAGPLGLATGIFYTVQYIVVKGRCSCRPGRSRRCAGPAGWSGLVGWHGDGRCWP